MEALSDLFSWSALALSVAGYFATLPFYRLFLYPLSRFPGPKLATASRLYEAYYDLVQDGQYTFKIAELHKQYGPIIRISPYELHVNDPAFFDHLYRQDGAWDKYDCRQDIINRHLDKLCDRISIFTKSQETFNFGAAITAFVRDVAFEFILGKNYKSLDKDDFDEAMVTATSGSGQVWRTSKHVRFIGPMFKTIPIDWLTEHGNHGTKLFFRFMKENIGDTERLVGSAKSPSRGQGQDDAVNIVHEILRSKLPESEKTTSRVFDEVATITGAGFETTAGALRVALFHVFDNPEILQRLRSELATVDTRDLKVLEQLPYLKAVLMEGLRISPALGTRMARIAPDRDLLYGHWRIPAGTPVGMALVLMHMDENLYPEPRRFNPRQVVGP
ncbi:hypothetical protein GQX73_g6110 [Xylaria multiplex]|uniref:Cytochrome P450 n=1 Tax=Xylaria multiplex TaxID=323545 RepID=A0A7C8MR76_9PEZI|nr:hypothetical protein GQX73_g6110 [Xylaria multiplex]